MTNLSQWIRSRVFWGALLILGGVALLLQNLGIFRFGSLFWAVAFGLAGVAFASVYFENRASWWSLIPGLVLIGLALSAFLDFIWPRAGSIVGGAIFLGCIGLGFILVYLADRQHWWAIIPGGVLLTLAVISVLDSVELGIETGGIFFLGIGLTFGALAVLPGQQDRLRWAFIPAAVLIVMGLVVTAASGEYLGILGAAVLVVFGAYLVYRAIRR